MIYERNDCVLDFAKNTKPRTTDKKFFKLFIIKISFNASVYSACHCCNLFNIRKDSQHCHMEIMQCWNGNKALYSQHRPWLRKIIVFILRKLAWVAHELHAFSILSGRHPIFEPSLQTASQIRCIFLQKSKWNCLPHCWACQAASEVLDHQTQWRSFLSVISNQTSSINLEEKGEIETKEDEKSWCGLEKFCS